MTLAGDPFSLLGVSEDATDADIKRAYLALVRRHSPESEPERFEAIRAAYDAIADRNRRLSLRWLRPQGRALHRLKQALLASGTPADPSAATAAAVPAARPKTETVDALLLHCARRYARDRAHRTD